MTIENLEIYLISFFLVTCALSLSGFRNVANRNQCLSIFVLSIICVVLITVVGSSINAGQNLTKSVFSRLLTGSRTDLTAFAFGVCSALPISLLWLSTGKAKAGTAATICTLIGIFGVLLFGVLFLAKDIISPYLSNPNNETKNLGIGKLAADGFTIEDYKNTSLIPVRIDTSPSGRVFVSGHVGIAAQSGGVVELVENTQGVVEEILVAKMLNRPYGLLATENEIFVSRSGQYTRWKEGRPQQISTGAVTLLRDLDGDRIMDYYHDIVTDLPGAKGPDYLHQNNDLTQGPDGALYITTANHADGYPASDPLEGVILKVFGDSYDQQEVFASGLRNPFGIEFDKLGRLFATDNDAQAGILGGLGDKLLKIDKGAFFGHPYSLDNEEGVTPPLLRSSFALGGLAYMEEGALPPPFGGSLFLVIYGEGRIVRLDYEEDNPNEVAMVPIATVPGAVDIAASITGDIYVAVYPDKVVRIRYTKKDTN